MVLDYLEAILAEMIIGGPLYTSYKHDKCVMNILSALCLRVNK